MLIMLYLRREPTIDAVTVAHGATAGRLDVAAYTDLAATDLKARWPWFAARKPTRRNDRVTLNCFDWAVCWLPDLTDYPTSKE